MKNKRDYADILKKERNKQNRRMKKKNTQMYQKYATLGEETYTDKSKHNNCVYKHEEKKSIISTIGVLN